jgi:hypothetical protein
MSPPFQSISLAAKRRKKSVHVHGDKPGYYQDKKQRVRFQIGSDFHIAASSEDDEVIGAGSGADANLVPG